VINDYSTEVRLFSPVCTKCKHFDQQSPLNKVKTCKAFPRGIPAAIWLGENLHKESYPGDQGIVFSLFSDK